MTGIPALRGAPSLPPAREAAAPGRGGFALPAGGAASGSMAGNTAAEGAAAGGAISGEPGAVPAFAVPVAVLGGLLALQEAEQGSPVRDRAARRHGRALLGALTAWQRALLGGASGEAEAALERLAALLDAAPPAADPSLAAVLAAVTLRCRIELARRG